MTRFADLHLALQELSNQNDQAKLLGAKEALIEKVDFGQKIYLVKCNELARQPSSDCESTFSDSFLTL
jgi:hypothetical protein